MDFASPVRELTARDRDAYELVAVRSTAKTADELSLVTAEHLAQGEQHSETGS